MNSLSDHFLTIIMDKQKRSHIRGFTLIELLVVLAILGMIVGLVGPQVMKNLGSAKTDTAKLQIADFGVALDMYYLQTGRYPTTSEGLLALIEAPAGVAGWNGPYLKKKKIPKDPWKKNYHYSSPGEHGNYDLLSYGADGKQGGEGENADISSWE